MAARKDSKGRALRNGETQRADGRYSFQFEGRDGKRKTVYSWTLNPSDKTPAGKKVDKSLREKEDEIKKMLDSGIAPDDKTTIKDIVLEYCDDIVKGKANSTRHQYNCVINHLKEQPFWNVRVVTVENRQAKKWINDMMAQNIGYGIMRKCKEVLKAAFDKAIEYEIINRNPFDFKMPKRDDAADKPHRRNALTQEQKTELLNYCKERTIYNRWYYVIVILLGTGLRISEFLGLTFDDVDFNSGLISVNHQITSYYNLTGQYEDKNETPMKVSKPKTSSGVRYIPMDEEVKAAFRWLCEHRPQVKEEYTLNGVSGFIFLNRFGRPSRAANVDSTFKNIIKAYNKNHDTQLPSITPHYLRHTFCSDMAQKGMNPKALQYIMGHSNTRMTMDVYAHANAELAINEMRSFEQKSDK